MCFDFVSFAHLYLHLYIEVSPSCAFVQFVKDRETSRVRVFQQYLPSRHNLYYSDVREMCSQCVEVASSDVMCIHFLGSDENACILTSRQMCSI